MRCTISELIPTARRSPTGEAKASGGRWKARKIAGTCRVIVRHHSTDMLEYRCHDSNYSRRTGDEIHESNPRIIPLSPGQGSVSDKQGINKVLSGIGSSLRYHSLYANENTSDKAPNHTHDCADHEPKPEPIERFVPPISVEDTIG